MKNHIKKLRKAKAIENDKYNPTLESAIKLAKLLDTTEEELFMPDT
ncbi:hypothetical protein CE91St62_05850 [Lachnospiraceae bacterium]|nr:helix-turn-helix domain-containing protein [Extibacter sp. GGCC_0201]MBO1719352.1 helix-turn-helix domain-containing protein [Extibacter sp. GGCC_0201]BDF32514.1 hypothetical protein CE91St61_05890 [Lachnospiraceae bacterium]BDF36524.1 hypothetical protein CE91St62_05850 [Lachnospiraceae bacterium]